MNLANTMSLLAGGPGSGCHGENCGRPPGPGHPEDHSDTGHLNVGDSVSYRGKKATIVAKQPSPEGIKYGSHYVRIQVEGDPNPINVHPDKIRSNVIKDKDGKEYQVTSTKDSSDRTVYLVHEKGANAEHAPLAKVTLRKEGNVVSHASVQPEYRRKGIATELYKHIEEDIGQKLAQNKALTEEGEAFWRSRK